VDACSLSSFSAAELAGIGGLSFKAALGGLAAV
jgi:hypothetical protein